MLLDFSVDLDKWTERELMSFLYSLEKSKRFRSIEYRLSSSGTGYHVRFQMSVPGYFADMVDMESFLFGVRYAFFDCLGRVKCDLSRHQKGLQKDRLFYRKDGKEAGRWKDV